MNEKINKAIKRIIDEWCSGCSHTLSTYKHCDFEDFEKHCAIANLICILREQ